LEKPVFTIHDTARVESEFRALRLSREDLRNVRTSFYKKHRTREEALARIHSAPLREQIARRVDFHPLGLVERRDSRLDGASKLLFRTRNDVLIETVILRIDSGRTALCVSSQAGCAAGCTFCATSRARAHDLSAAEILDQLVQAAQLLEAERRRIRNVVFMGMGEPFHNEEQVHGALEVLTSPRCFNHSERKLLISTVGVPDAMVRCAHRFPGVNLALSLHTVRPDIRRKIIPLARVHTLAALRSAVREINSLQRHPVMIEYLMLRGLTDTPADLEALVRYLEDLRVHINLIPYNPIEEAPELTGTDRAGCEAFADALKRSGYHVTLRASLGRDIAAACGQLARRSGG
jgi:23S rRNA (adenine2503-C2)-methyltransferase